MVRALRGGTPMPIGMPLRDQLRDLRSAMLRAPFETFERHIRDQMARALAAGGFDPARDIEAIVVNRWPEGYALPSNSLFDPERAEHEEPFVVGRKPFGRITVANSDASGIDLTQTAFDEAHRAVTELMPRRYGWFSRI
jgi:spermidine dehydrogenase